MRNFSYLKQITANRKLVISYDPFNSWLSYLVIRAEQENILMSFIQEVREIISVHYAVKFFRKTLFSNKRFFWKRKRRIGL